MAIPSRKCSSTRVKKRLGFQKLKFSKRVFNRFLVKCFDCQETKIMHHICPHCLKYRFKSFFWQMKHSIAFNSFYF